MNVDDIFLILHHHWVLETVTFRDGRQRLQLHFLVLVSAYTATRPEALVYVARNEKLKRGYCIGENYEDEDDEEDEEDGEDEKVNEGNTRDRDRDNELMKTLCYKDVCLFLLPNPDGIRDVLVMEIDLSYIKGHQRKPKR